MCGIIGYTGRQAAANILLNGLKRLEYRGYDSAGIALLQNHKLVVYKEVGKVAALAEKIENINNDAHIGIGHTRWATHGVPNKTNAHPHVSQNRVAVVHNGIIENYQELRAKLEKTGYRFKSQTDTEVLAHLIHFQLNKQADLKEAVRQALSQVSGTFGIVVLDTQLPDTLIAARRGSPLLIGVGEDETFIASDATAIVGHTNSIVYLEDDELAVVTAETYQLFDLSNHKLKRQPEAVEMELSAIEKAGYEHFLLKEIMEQPQSVENCLRGRLDSENGTAHLGGLNISDKTLRSATRIVTVGCGTASYAGLVGKYLLERLIGIPVQVEIGSEFRYREPALNPTDLAFIISQSGETADTIASLRELKRQGVPTVGFVNVVGSSIAREVDGGVYIHAGPEISVASTKAFTTQVVAQLLFGLYIARLQGLSLKEGKAVVKALADLPKQISEVLSQAATIKRLAKKIARFNNALYLGRDSFYAVALEGSHKLKEISYIHAEAYPTGEMKHGVNALIDKDLLVVVLCPKDNLHSKSLNNLEEISARGGTIVALTNAEDKQAKRLAQYVIEIPSSSMWTQGLLMNIALQLLAYFVAIERGTNVDQPRNLAKSVTVE